MLAKSAINICHHLTQIKNQLLFCCRPYAEGGRAVSFNGLINGFASTDFKRPYEMERGKIHCISGLCAY